MKIRRQLTVKRLRYKSQKSQVYGTGTLRAILTHDTTDDTWRHEGHVSPLRVRKWRWLSPRLCAFPEEAVFKKSESIGCAIHRWILQYSLCHNQTFWQRSTIFKVKIRVNTCQMSRKKCFRLTLFLWIIEGCHLE